LRHIQVSGEKFLQSRSQNMEIAVEKLLRCRSKDKLLEEAEEFKKDENIEEFADILEVIDPIADYKKFDRKEIEKVREKKAEERGKFRDKIILDESYPV